LSCLDLKTIVQYTGEPTKEGVLSWQKLLDIGKQVKSEESLENRLKQVAINQCCHLVYTSGTTGPPKAVMLSHDNLTFCAEMLKIVYDLKMSGEERNVSYLPLSHVAANMVDIFLMITCQGTTYFADKNALKVIITFVLISDFLQTSEDLKSMI
jgi:long-chain-fatty-acid--CoA ligase ACSBG